MRAEKCKLEQTLEQEQECLVNKLMRKIEKLEAETVAKQNNLEQLRREKVIWLINRIMFDNNFNNATTISVLTVTCYISACLVNNKIICTQFNLGRIGEHA